MRTYGIENPDSIYDTTLGVFDQYTSTKISKPILTASATSSDAVIAEDGLTITNLDAVFKNPGDNVLYTFIVKNEGQYDAYLRNEDFIKLKDINKTKICTPKEGATLALVEKACETINILVGATSSDGKTSFNSNGTGQSSEIIKINKANNNNYDYIMISFLIVYGNANTSRADGDFEVSFDDVKLNFSTTSN